MTVTGFGTTREGGSSSDKLMEVEVPVVSNAQCSNSYPGYITFNHICAGKEGKDSCQGDSGGPLFWSSNSKFYLTGIVSFGQGCARPNYPGVYTRVTSYLNWIKTNTGM